jgi:hypothetical protein
MKNENSPNFTNAAALAKVQTQGETPMSDQSSEVLSLPQNLGRNNVMVS